MVIALLLVKAESILVELYVAVCNGDVEKNYIPVVMKYYSQYSRASHRQT